MNRRNFIKYTSALAFSGICPDVLAYETPGDSRRLILIELKGGNDGLNTLIPYKNELYQKIRPRLHIREKDLTKIDTHLGIGLNKKLDFLINNNSLKDDVAIFHSVGYPTPNKSHFKGITYWENASLGKVNKGWVARVLDDESNRKLGRNSTTKGVVIGDKTLGPLVNTKSDILVVDDLKRMLNKRNIDRFNLGEARGNGRLRHIIETENSILNQLSAFHDKVNIKTKRATGFEKDVMSLINIVESFKDIPFFKLSIGGFDTHRSQSETHAKLLGTLNDGLATLVRELKKKDLYDSTLIMTYSEFGRRPKENASRGTDHGEANCHFILGGKVKGGKVYFGKQANTRPNEGGYELSQAHLDGKENISYKIDFRDIYQKILTDWWQVKGLDSYRDENDDLGYRGLTDDFSFLKA